MTERLNVWLPFFFRKLRTAIAINSTLKKQEETDELTFAKTSGIVASPVTIPETIARHISTPVPFSFLKLGILIHFQEVFITVKTKHGFQKRKV